MYHTLGIFFITQKVLEISFSFYPTFNKTELSVFCQKMKVIGLTQAFLRPFLSVDLKKSRNRKMQFQGVKSNFRPMVNLTFFVPHIKIHISTNFKSLGQKMRSKLQKQNFRKILAKKWLLKHFCRSWPYFLSDFQNSFFH